MGRVRPPRSGYAEDARGEEAGCVRDRATLDLLLLAAVHAEPGDGAAVARVLRGRRREFERQVRAVRAVLPAGPA